MGKLAKELLLAAAALAAILTFLLGVWPSCGLFSGPDNILDEVATRTIWTSRPQTFDSADDEENGSRATLDAEGDDVFVVTPSELATRGLEFVGEFIFVVGRVEEARTLPTEFGFAFEDSYVELRLATDGKTNMYVRSIPDEAPDVGAVIWAVGRVAAFGDTRLPSGRVVPTAYFLVAPLGAGITEWLGEDFLPPGSRNLREALRNVPTK
jgi:hypothetical protein